MVVAQFTIITSTFTYTTATGAIQITGLPFASNSTANVSFIGSTGFGGWNHAGYTQMTPDILPGTSAIVMFVSGPGVSGGGENITNFPTGGTVNLQGTITYYTD